MTGSENDNKSSSDHFEDQEEVDEELLALAPPPPSMRHAIIVAVILVLSVFLMITFFDDLNYLLKGFSGPVELGEIDQVYYDEFEHNSYVELHGIPNITRSILANEGVKWFAMSDNSHKWFSLSGKQNLLVNWTISDEEKAFRDPAVNPERLSLPYDFKGQLLRTEVLKANHAKILLYFECLELYSVRECKYCLGVDDIDVCRELFTCIEEKNPVECDGPPPGLKDGRLTGDVLARAVAELEERGKLLLKAIDERRKLMSNINIDLNDIESGAMLNRLKSERDETRNKIVEAGREAVEKVNELKKRGLDSTSVKGRLRTLSEVISQKIDQVNNLKKQVEGPGKKTLKASVDGGVEEKSAADAGVAEPNTHNNETPLVEIDPAELEAIKNQIKAALKEKKEAEKEKETLRELANGINDLYRVKKERDDRLVALGEEIKAVNNGSAAKEKKHLIAVLQPKLTEMEAAEPSLKELLGNLDSVTSDNLDEMREKMDRMKAAIGPGTWVLIDGEAPIEKLWIVLVYLVLGTMVVFNVRRLLQFIAAWRA